MHRSTTLFLTLALMMVSGSAAADHSRPCPDFTQHHAVAGQEAAFNEDGWVLLTAEGGSHGTYYVVSDENLANSDGRVPFSIWVYPEANGEPGLQRHDESCTNADDGETDASIF